MTAIVEAEPIDERAVLDEPEHPWAQIAFLWFRSDGAYLAEAQPHTAYGIVHACVLVEARRDAQRICKRAPPQLYRQARVVRRERARIYPCFQRLERQLVGSLRVEGEEQGPDKIENGAEHETAFGIAITARSINRRRRQARC